MRLLVAEDDREIGKALKTILERSYYSVDVVHDGKHAMDYIASGEYDGIILDIMMPGTDGIEVLTGSRDAATNTMVYQGAMGICRKEAAAIIWRMQNYVKTGDASGTIRLG